MSEADDELIDVCPDCGAELWYDEEGECWVCETCGIEFYEEDWEEEEWEEEEEAEEGNRSPSF